MPDLQQFRDFTALADAMVERASAEQLAEVARILALTVADYRLHFGERPPAYLMEMTKVEDLNEEQARLVTEGAFVLCGMLVAVVGDLDEFESPVH